MKKHLLQLAYGAAALLALFNIGVPYAKADQQVNLHFSMPVHVDATINETGCDNSPGPQITVEGQIRLGGLEVEMIFKNNVKGTHTAVVTFDTKVALVPVGG